MKTTLAGPSPIEQFLGRLRDSGIHIASTHQTFQVDGLLTQGYLLNAKYRLLLADTRAFLLEPTSNGVTNTKLKLLPESEMDKSFDYVRHFLERIDKQ
jgi:hypothetical protein